MLRPGRDHAPSAGAEKRLRGQAAEGAWGAGAGADSGVPPAPWAARDEALWTLEGGRAGLGRVSGTISRPGGHRPDPLR